MGLGFYGRSFTLSDPSCSTPGCGFSGGANPGPCSASAGTLMNSEIQQIIQDGAQPTLDKDAAVKQIVWDSNQWVSYDDEETLKMKIDYANGKCLGGTMVWAVSTDDSNYTSTTALQGLNGLSQKSLFGGPSPKPVDTLSTCSKCNDPDLRPSLIEPSLGRVWQGVSCRLTACTKKVCTGWQI